MKTNYLILFVFACLFCWLGVSFYFSTLDGYFFPPLTFRADEQQLKTDKLVYKAGDTISIHNSFCRNRNYTVTTTWRLFNATVITFPEKGSHVTATGCVDSWFTIGEIPKYATPGIHFLEAVSEIQLNPMKKLYLNYKSVEFQVI